MTTTPMIEAMEDSDETPSTDQPHPTLQILQQAVAALADGDWAQLRRLCHNDVVSRLPGRSPIAGEVAGVDAVLERYQRTRRATANDRRPRLVTFLEGGDYAAVVQPNWISGEGQGVLVHCRDVDSGNRRTDNGNLELHLRPGCSG